MMNMGIEDAAKSNLLQDEANREEQQELTGTKSQSLGRERQRVTGCSRREQHPRATDNACGRKAQQQAPQRSARKVPKRESRSDSADDAGEKIEAEAPATPSPRRD